jgi:3-oxoacyl-[acyl-carrier protein] reductase
MSKLAGKVAVVTGASKGIGAGIARALAAAGASVVVNYASSKEGAERVVAEIEAKGGKAIAVQADVAKAADVKRLFADTKRAFDKLDILVNNAGVYGFSPLEGITEEEFHREYNTNVLGLILATQAAVAAFGDAGGSIVNIGTAGTRAPVAGGTLYLSTKGAVDVITVSLAKELGPRKIRVNQINPGGTETEGAHAAGIIGSPFEKMMVDKTPLGRLGQPGDIGPVAVFLASDDAAWVTGELLHASGGA